MGSFGIRIGRLHGLRRLRHLGLALLGVTLLAVVSVWTGSIARAQEASDWSGDWDTLWPGGGARITFTQDANVVVGSYPVLDGAIEAKAEGRRLFGRWSHDGVEGSFLFVMSADGRTFAGRFGTGSWWTGVRATPDFDPALRVTRDSPAATMQSFLRLAGRADGGSLEWLGRAAKLVVPDPSTADRTSLLQQVGMLDQVLRQLTFRFIELPRGGGEEVSRRLEQAGTGVGLDLAFRLVDGDWLIVAPPAAELTELLERLKQAGGGRGEAARTNELSNPRATMQTFIRGMRAPAGPARDAAYRSLNASEFPEIAASRELPLIADFLFQVIDRVGYVYWEEIPDDAADRTPYVHYRHPAGDVVVAPYREDGRTVWQFTPDTLRSIRAVHAAVEDLPLPPELEGRTIVDPYFRVRRAVHDFAPSLLAPLWSLERWQWLGIVGLLAAGLAAGRLAARATPLIAPHRVVADGASPRPDDRVVLMVLRTAITAVVVGFTLFLIVGALGIPPVQAGLAVSTGAVLIIVGLVPVLWETITRAVDRYCHRRTITPHQETFIAMVSSLVRIALVGAAALLLATLFQVPYQGMLAGLGIGGLAVALAVQPVLQNFVAGLVLYADHPLNVGDFCRYGDKLGTVESVGMRSTRIRSLDRTVITVPNAEFANMQLENYTRRDRMWLRSVIQVRYETSPDQMRYLLAELRGLLLAHPRVLDEPMRVRFIGFGAYSLDVEIFAYVATADYDDFVAVREDILLKVMATVGEAGCQFAFPSTVEYRADDTPPDAAEREKAEAAVRRWRESGSFPFPDLDPREEQGARSDVNGPPGPSAVAGRVGP